MSAPLTSVSRASGNGGRASLRHLPALQGIRAIAVAAVVLYHLDLRGFSGGFLGVDLFFTLSGFLITRLLLAEYADTGRISLLDFYDRRFRRLLPAVITLVAVIVVVQDVWGTAISDRIRLSDVRSVLFYVGNWHLISTAQDYFEAGPDVSPLRHMWSLAVEEQFYVAWPLITVAALAIGRRIGGWARRTGFIALALALTGVSAALFAARYEPGLVSRAYYGTDTRVFQLLLGAVAAGIERDAVARGVDRWSARMRQSVVAGGLIVVGACIVFVDAQDRPYYYGVGVAFSAVAALIVYQLSRVGTGGLVAALSWSPAVLVGTISYGIYLWHWPIIRWITPPADATFLELRMVNALQIGATVAAAFVSFHLIEQPLRSGFGLRRIPAATRLGALALPVILVVTVSGRVLAPPPSDPIVDALEDTSVTSCPNDEFPCVVADFRDGGDGPTVAVVGDSTIQSFTVGFLDEAERRGWRVVNAARGACPIAHLLVQYGSSESSPGPNERQVQCHDMHDDIWAELVDVYDPDVYLAGSISDRLPHRTDGEFVAPGTARHFEETGAGLVDALSWLAQNGAPIVLVESLPLGFGVPCYQERGSEEACFRPIADDAVNEPYHQLMRDVAATVDSDVSLLNLDDHVCQPDGCPLRVDGVVARYDGTHLTGTMSRRLGPFVVEALVATGAVG